MDKPDIFDTFVVCTLIMYGIILSMIGPGLSFAAYMVHYAISFIPAGLLVAAIWELWDNFWEAYFTTEAEKVIRG